MTCFRQLEESARKDRWLRRLIGHAGIARQKRHAVFLTPRTTLRAKAMKQAGIVLGQINFFEYHDMFSIYAALQLEAVGSPSKAKAGNSPPMVRFG
ncbi:MAG: hypothetical protein IPO36_14710 [Anaerolineales bacterium]|nr:hypothetical protein [Anaerolineales bacterium]